MDTNDRCITVMIFVSVSMMCTPYVHVMYVQIMLDLVRIVEWSSFGKELKVVV